MILRIFFISVFLSATVTFGFAQDWSFLKKIFPEPLAPSGAGVAIDVFGNYAVTSGEGVAFLLKFNGVEWVKVQKIRYPDINNPESKFGTSVAISSNWIAVGSNDKVHLFRFENEDVFFHQTLFQTNSLGQSGFGRSIAITNSHLIVGAFHPNFNNNGQVYLYHFQNPNWVLQRMLAPEGIDPNAGLGFVVDLEENLAVVGIPSDQSTGAVFLFDGQSEWSQVARIADPSPQPGEQFGSSVQLKNQQVVIGAPYRDANSNPNDDSGSVFVFQRVNGSWVKTWSHQFTTNGRQGWSVAMGDNQLVVGSDVVGPGVSDRTTVFRRAGEDWIFEQLIQRPNDGGTTRFGFTIAVHDQCLLIGDNGAPQKGQLFVLKNVVAQWEIVQTIAPLDNAFLFSFGDNLVADGGFLAVKTRHFENSSEEFALKIFRKSGDEYHHDTTLVSPFFDNDFGRFASGLAIQNRKLLFQNRPFGVAGQDLYPGGVYYYEYLGDQWIQRQLIRPPSDVTAYAFGANIALDGNWAVVSTESGQTFSLPEVYFYFFNGTNWELRQQVSAESLGLELVDRFGLSVSVNGEYAAIGAPGRDLAAFNSGAVYVYRFNGTNWVQSQVITHPNPTGDEGLGFSVSLSNDRMAIGVPGLVSSKSQLLTYKLTAGTWQHEQLIQIANVNDRNAGRELKLEGSNLVFGNASTFDARGFAYVYQLRNSHWTQTGYIKSATRFSNFGISLDLDDDLLVVGEPANNEVDETAGTVNVYKNQPNLSPYLANPITDQRTTINAPFAFRVPANTFVDPEGQPLVLTTGLSSGSRLPAWLTFHGSSGLYSGMPPEGTLTDYQITLVAFDGAASVSDTFNIVVRPPNQAPTLINAIPDMTATAGQPFEFQVPANTFSDPEGQDLIYQLFADDGAALPAWLFFDGATRKMMGTPPMESTGIQSFKLLASDQEGAQAFDFFDIRIEEPPNQHPVLDQPLIDVVIDENVDFTFEINRNSFRDPENATLNYTATLANGTALPDWLDFENPIFSGRAPIGSAGIYSIRVIATDEKLAAVSDEFDLTVTERIITSVAVSEIYILYPNPTRSEFFVRHPTQATFSIRVVSLSGQTVQESLNTGANTPISLRGIPAGAYLVFIQDLDQGHQHVEKLFIRD